ncbi:MAG: M48 family metalloprotease [Treponema sp.]|jgi:predicted Zn-dependent protease|nr:M48 family metalloprotease [Treponema sp.]
MKTVFALVIGFLAFSPLAAQNGAGGSRALGADVSGALSQMGGALASADDDVSPLDAYFLGRAVAANIIGRYRPYTRKPEADRYLNEICAAITVNSPMPDMYNGYHVMILDAPELNAFATSGGHIFITRGLLEALPSEDALAAVLAHEIAHIQLQHSVELIRHMRITRDLSHAADRAADIAAREASLRERKTLFDNAVRNMVTALTVNGYSREQEFQADIYAVRLLSLAGYAPASLADVLALLQKTTTTGGLNGTHPSPAQRGSNVRQELTRNSRFYQAQDTASSRAARFERFSAAVNSPY